MRAVVMREFGPEDVLQLEQVPEPSPSPGQVLVRVAAVEVSRTRDIATRTGKHPFSRAVTLPRILGGDFSGTIVAVGEGVDEGRVGERVAVSNTETCGRCEACRSGQQERCLDLTLLGIHRDGSYAELATIAAANAHPIPDDLSLAEAAALAADGSIAFTQLEVAGVGPGTELLVTGVTGALGSTLAALASRIGARVLGLSRRPEAIPAGLELTAVDATDPELTETLTGADRRRPRRRGRQRRQPRRLRRLLPGAEVGARVVFSGAIGTPELPVLPVPAAPLYVKSISLLGVRTTTPADRGRFWDLVADGFRLPPRPDRGAAAGAKRRRRRRRSIAGTHLGHTLLTPGT